MYKKLFLILLLVLSAPSIYGETYIANGNVNVRVDYPKFPFYRNAKVIGTVKKDAQVALLERKNVFNYEWLKIKVKTSGLVGWVYNGETGKTPYFTKKEGN